VEGGRKSQDESSCSFVGSALLLLWRAESEAATSSRRRPRTWQFPQQRGSPRQQRGSPRQRWHWSQHQAASFFRSIAAGAGAGAGAAAAAAAAAGAGAGAGLGARAGV